jgi:hypothetical protein
MSKGERNHEFEELKRNCLPILEIQWKIKPKNTKIPTCKAIDGEGGWKVSREKEENLRC